MRISQRDETPAFRIDVGKEDLLELTNSDFQGLSHLRSFERRMRPHNTPEDSQMFPKVSTNTAVVTEAEITVRKGFSALRRVPTSVSFSGLVYGFRMQPQE
jgi:hypothetical protein